MKKDVMRGFIAKYNFTGVESVKWETDGNSLKVRFLTPDQNLGGEIKTDQLSLDVGVYGICNVSSLLGQLNILGDDIEVSVVKRGSRDTALRFTDGTYKAQFMLADMSAISEVPTEFAIPPMDVTLTLDAEFIEKFIKSVTALSDAETFTVFCEGNAAAKMVLGHSKKINSNTIELPILGPVVGMSEKGIVFQAKLMKELLLANKECKTVKFKYSESGLAVLDFDVEGFELKYYMVAVDDV